MTWELGSNSKRESELNRAFEALHKHLVWMQSIVPDLIKRVGNQGICRVDKLKDALLEEARKEKISTALVPVLIEEVIRQIQTGEIEGRWVDDPPAELQKPKSEGSDTGSATPKGTQDTNSDKAPKSPENTTPSNNSETVKPKKRKRKGGRKAGQRNLVPADFKKSVTVLVSLSDEAKPGSLCPCCHEKELQSAPPAELIRYGASCPVPVTRVLVEKSRCKACGQHFEAQLAQDWSRETCIGNFTPKGIAMSILLRYGLGFPDLRLETLQDWDETPLSTSTQWQASLTLWESLLPLWDEFLQFAANAEQRQLDDCSTRIIALKKEIEEELTVVGGLGLSEKQMRTGVQCTVVVATKAGITIRLFVSGRHHQGEIEHELGELRTIDSPVINITDAASKSESVKSFPGKNEFGFVPAGSAVQKSKKDPQAEASSSICVRIHANCLEHLRQTLEKARPGFQAEVTFLLEKLSEVFRLERESQSLGHSPEERLAWHQKQSLPLLEQMKTRAVNELETNKKAEPNGEYAGALRYFLNHYEKFTTFTRHKDVPLTTSHAEAGAKFSKRHLKNSLSYQSAKGSKVGDFFMSLIATCNGSGINPLEYLESLARWRHDITPENAADWLPHKFRQAERKAEEQHQLQETEKYRLRPRRTKKDPELADPMHQQHGPNPEHQTLN